VRKIKKILSPKIHPTAYVHPRANVMGEVTLKEHASVWPGAVLRGDINSITIGKYTNIQDLTVAHIGDDEPVVIGDYVTCGHQVTLHGCRVGKGTLIGIGSVLLNNVTVGTDCVIGAGSLVTEGSRLKSKSLYYGRPAKFIRKLRLSEIKMNYYWAKKYAKLAEIHNQGLIRESTF